MEPLERAQQGEKVGAAGGGAPYGYRIRGLGFLKILSEDCGPCKGHVCRQEFLVLLKSKLEEGSGSGRRRQEPADSIEGSLRAGPHPQHRVDPLRESSQRPGRGQLGRAIIPHP